MVYIWAQTKKDDIGRFPISWYIMVFHVYNYWKDFLTTIYNYGMEETIDGFGKPQNWETTIKH